MEKGITDINVPIKKHHNIPRVLEVLLEHFAYRTVPDYIFDLIDLPEPSFDIFDKQEITETTTNLQEIPTTTDMQMTEAEWNPNITN